MATTRWSRDATDGLIRRWRVLPRLQVELIRYIHHQRSSNRYVWQLHVIYDRPPAEPT